MPQVVKHFAKSLLRRQCFPAGCIIGLRLPSAPASAGESPSGSGGRGHMWLSVDPCSLVKRLAHLHQVKTTGLVPVVAKACAGPCGHGTGTTAAHACADTLNTWRYDKKEAVHVDHQGSSTCEGAQRCAPRGPCAGALRPCAVQRMPLCPARSCAPCPRGLVASLPLLTPHTGLSLGVGLREHARQLPRCFAAAWEASVKRGAPRC